MIGQMQVFQSLREGNLFLTHLSKVNLYTALLGTHG